MDSKNLAEPTSEDSRSHSPIIHGYNMTGDSRVYYVVMERLITKLNDIEHELKCAWRILDILNQECIKMWERLEKLEGFLYEQQNVITELVEFHSADNDREKVNAINESIVNQQSTVGELDAIAESLGAAIGIEETSVLREKLAQQELIKIQGLTKDSMKSLTAISDIQKNSKYLDVLETLAEEGAIPDEAFYRSLNNAYREDLICGDSSRPTSQLGMIWEEAEDIDDSIDRKDFESNIVKKNVDTEIHDTKAVENSTLSQNTNETSQSVIIKQNEDDDEGEVFSAADYKSYRGNTPCISEQDLAQLSRLSCIDEVSLEKLHELNKLTSKLQKDSQNFLEFRSRFIETPKDQYSSEIEIRLNEEPNNIDEQIRKIYAETDVDNWTYSKSPNSTGRSMSRVSTDSGLTTDGDYTARSISPRLNSASKINIDSINSTYTSSKVGFAISLFEESPETIIQLPIDVGSFAKGYAENKELTDLMVESFVPVTCSSPAVFNSTIEKLSSPAHSISSIHSNHSTRTRQDGYFGSKIMLNLDFPENKTPQSSSPVSPPPPAPHDSNEGFILTTDQQEENNIKQSESSNFLQQAEKALNQDKLSPRTPHSPKSPRISPKHSIKTINHIVAAKSDSGLSSMSGWSSLDKSPTSPKNSIAKILTSYSLDNKSSLILTNQSSKITSPTPPVSEAVNVFISENYLYNPIDEQNMNSNQIVAATNDLCQIPFNHLQSSLNSGECSTIQKNLSFISSPISEKTILQSPKNKIHSHTASQNFNFVSTDVSVDYICLNSQPALYSVAGSNRPEEITTVYTRGSGPNISTTGHYPDVKNALSDYKVNYDTFDTAIVTTISNSHIHQNKASKVISHPDNLANYDSYKTTVYRTMFPTGNITDALTYYPTSVTLPKTEPVDNNWPKSVKENKQEDNSASVKSIILDENHHKDLFTEKNHSQPPSYQSSTSYHSYDNEYFMQGYQKFYQPYNQHLFSTDNSNLNNAYQHQWKKEYLIEQDLFQAQSDQGQGKQEFYDASSVIVSQSGYISISSDIKDYEADSTKSNKKIRRGSSLKNAMNSMSSWLPDLHLTKRHRSQSLPGGVRREDLDVPADPLGQRLLNDFVLKKSREKSQILRKKKKHTLVSTMSGILQKAKRKTYHTQSLSDPEQSETEWSSGRQSALSEDEDSTLSDINQEAVVFAKVRSTSTRKPLPEISSHQQQYQERQKKETLLFHENLQQQQELHQQIQQHQEQLQQKFVQENWIHDVEMQNAKPEVNQQEYTEQIRKFEDENSSKNSVPCPTGSSIFATVGDIKKSSNNLDEISNDKTAKLPPVALMGGASMEFAVSRALGKYRQRQSSTIYDDQNEDLNNERKYDESTSQTIDNNLDYQENISEKGGKSDKGSALPELITNISQDVPGSESSPASSVRNTHGGSRFLPKHQQSLEIPWAGSRSGDGDEDNRSTHSLRSTSRVSSRRQSTEDSIDSEDEWYCYELRKLEELERQSESTIETDTSRILVTELEELEIYQPDEDVKEKMSFVLEELKLKSETKDEFNKIEFTKEIEVPEVNGSIINKDMYRSERPAPKKKSAEPIETVFARVTDYHTWVHEEDKKERKTILEEESSGETSGPDSPVHSIDDEEEKELEEQYSRRSSSGSTLRHSEKFLHGSDSLSREGSVSVPPSEVSVSIPGAWDSESTMLEGERDGAVSTETGTTATFSLPKIKVDTSSCASSDATLKDGQVSPGPPSSKWKLLKALKERKAEEKLKEVEEATKESVGTTQGSTAVSITIK